MSSLSPKSNGISKTGVTSKETIGDFIIGEKLGEGTFSKVCQGTHKITGEKVAIKIMSKAQIKDPSDKLRIEKEINIQKRLHHNCIIQQYCIIETKPNIYIITEYCSGGELFEYIVNKRKLYEVEACRIFQQLISGLEYLHKQRIVHRDLKPENLLFDNRHNLKIADFGLSNEYKGKLTTPCGSPCYAAPEMVTGKDYNGSSVDIWSSGIVLYTMVCGYLPFEDENQNLLFSKIAKGLFSLPSYLSASCKDLLKSILVTDPKKRFGFEQIKHHPWFLASNNVMGKNIFFNSPGLFIKEDVIPVDEEIVKYLHLEYKYDLKTIISDVIRNKHNNITTSYYLILKRKIRTGKKSISDISPNSEPFLNYIKTSFSKLEFWKKNVDKIIDHYYKKAYKLIFHVTKKENSKEDDDNTNSGRANSDRHLHTVSPIEEISSTRINGGYAIVSMPTVLNNNTETNRIIPKEETFDGEDKEELTSNDNIKKESKKTYNNLETHIDDGQAKILKTENQINFNNFSNTMQYTKPIVTTVNDKINLSSKPSSVIPQSSVARKINSFGSNSSSNKKQPPIYKKISTLQTPNQINKFINKKHSNRETSSHNNKLITETIIEKKPNGLEPNHVIPLSILTTEPMPYLNGGTVPTNLQNYKLESEKITKPKEKKRPRSIDAYINYVNNTENINNVETPYFNKPKQEPKIYYKIEHKTKQNGGNRFNIQTKPISSTASTSVEKKKFLNTSLLISNEDNRGTSPLENKINQIIKKRNQKSLISSHAKATHYSQEHVYKKTNDMELACPKNNGNSFILTNHTIGRNQPKKTKYTNIGKLKKFINATIPLNSSNCSKQKNLSMPKNSYKQTILLKEREFIANQNKLFMTICTKKSIDAIKDVVESVIHSQVNIIKNPHSKIQIKCKIVNKLNLCFLLNVSKLSEVKDYYVITPNVLHGNMQDVKPLFEKIKRKLIQ